MKKIILAQLFLVFAAFASAQEPDTWNFKELSKVPCTAVKNQEQTGTCWCFSTTSFIESEIIKLGKGEQNLSEMFVVRHIYRRKCENYVRRQGSARWGEGGLAHDMMAVIGEYGIVPESAYPGKKDPTKPLNHEMLGKNLKTYLDSMVVLGTQSKLPADWLVAVDKMLDDEFGPLPAKFTEGGRTFTPLAYADYLGIHPDDYINLTSFTHHDFYKPFILEVPDNWANGSFYNVPLEDLMRTMDYALEHSFSVEWDADVSNRGWATKYGIALVPEVNWEAKTDIQKQNTFKFREKEKQISQELRQRLFDRQETMDDHLMHIVGAEDEEQNGRFYMVKNSWGESNSLKGFMRVSKAYMELNTISITLHRNAIPEDLKRRLGIDNSPIQFGPNRRERGRPMDGNEQPKVLPKNEGNRQIAPAEQAPIPKKKD